MEEKEDSKEDSKEEQDTSQFKVMKKDVYLDMIKSMYRIMIQGFSGNRIKKIKKDIQKGVSKSDIYLRLCTQEFDENEYRLSLWLPLSVEEKVDMVLN
mmetsp:Transcript_3290/g.3274  ORF Transcript_3290/g.3274 Transcript_3290/m.3274 type:complete len:98 (-) Transcript_3290:55-348(-)